jgi:hypothetical protein
MVASATGAMVSSIAPYSETAPVLHVWKRWLRFGNSFGLAFAISNQTYLGRLYLTAVLEKFYSSEHIVRESR